MRVNREWREAEIRRARVEEDRVGHRRMLVERLAMLDLHDELSEERDRRRQVEDAALALLAVVRRVDPTMVGEELRALAMMLWIEARRAREAAGGQPSGPIGESRRNDDA